MRRSALSSSLATLAATVALGVGSALVLPAAPAQAAGGDRAGDVARHALRAGDVDDSFYFVMGDRFANGDTANDDAGIADDPDTGYPESGFDPTSRGFYNGGDLEGLTEQLDYIEGLGTDAIWLTPIFENKPVQPEDGPSAGYHGYWITDFTQVDPHLGTNADLADLVDAAHARGIKVFFDIITNHTADVIGYDEGARTAYVSKDQEPYRTSEGKPFDDRDYAGTGSFPALDPDTSFPYRPVLDPAEEDLKVPAWLNDVRNYHNRGDTTFTGENSQYGDFFGLDDLFTEKPEVRDGMIRIYRTWVKDFGIDGFRIDTMKHVDDAFWQAFGPGLLDYARSHGKPDFFMFGEVALDGSDAKAKSFTSHYTTHDGMQAVLDFPFQWAARDFASKGGTAASLARFFADDDWYTDADSNAQELPTFLGNHDMGRFGYFVREDNKKDPTLTDDELLRRDLLGHELMYFSRGNPVVYYGDEQGFTGTGGDQLARQTMFASQVPDYQDDDQLGSTETPATDSFDTDHPIYQRLATLDGLLEHHRALRRGAQQVRYAADGQGILAFSRIDRRQQREYVVAVNNAESEQTADVPTWVPSGAFDKVYGEGPDQLTSDGDRQLALTVPPLSTVVYASTAPIPASRRAPSIDLRRPAPTEVAHSRTRVGAKVGGDSFYEVTFQAKVAGGRWRDIGTDDSAPYRVFHDTADLATGTRVAYRAAVLDNAGHARLSGVRHDRVGAPRVDVTAAGRDGEVNRLAPVTVTAAVDPERATQSVRFERSVAGGAWETLRTDTSSPVYTVTDDVSDLDLGTEVRYRATLLEPGTPRVVDTVTVLTANPWPLYDSVTVAGNLQSELGCTNDWDPACAATHLVFDASDGNWRGEFTLPAGSYEWKIATNDSWTVAFGAGGGGSNLTLEVPEGGATYEFVFDQASHVPSASEVTAP